MSTFKERVVDFVRHIPKGKLIYFGLISEHVGGSAQSVGWVLTGLTPEESVGVPWHRVVAKNGYISALKLGEKGQLQKLLLQEEGFTVINDHVDVMGNLWSGPNQTSSPDALF